MILLLCRLQNVNYKKKTTVAFYTTKMSGSRKGTKELSNEIKKVIVGLQVKGESFVKISDLIDIPVFTVRSVYYRFEKRGTVKNLPHTGCPPSFSPSWERLCVRTAQKNRFLDYNELSKLLPSSASINTIKRRLYTNGLYRRKARKAPFLNKKARSARYLWAKQNRVRNSFSNIIFSDESYIFLGSNNGTVYVTRKTGEAYKEECMVPIFKQSPIRIMVWGCIALGVKGPLICLKYGSGRGGGMTAKKYQEQVLNGAALRFYRRLRHRRPFLSFQQDNAPIHKAQTSMDWFKKHKFMLFPHPPSSPDLNPIEPVWWELKKAIRRRPHTPTSYEELEIAIREEWERIPQEKIDAYILSMHNRVKAVLKAHGGPTKY